MLQGKIYAKEVDDKPKGCVRSKFGISWEGRKNIIFGWGGGSGYGFWIDIKTPAARKGRKVDYSGGKINNLL
jgi:hypothetical protein